MFGFVGLSRGCFVGLSRGCFVGLTRGGFFTLNFSKFWKDIVLLFFGHFVNVHIKEICGKTAEFDDSETIWSSWSFSTKSLFDEFFSGAGNKWGSPTWLRIMSSNMFPSTSLKKSSTEKKEIEKLSQRMRKTSLANAISRQILLWSYFFLFFCNFGTNKSSVYSTLSFCFQDLNWDPPIFGTSVNPISTSLLPM